MSQGLARWFPMPGAEPVRKGRKAKPTVAHRDKTKYKRKQKHAKEAPEGRPPNCS